MNADQHAVETIADLVQTTNRLAEIVAGLDDLNTSLRERVEVLEQQVEALTQRLG